MSKFPLTNILYKTLEPKKLKTLLEIFLPNKVLKFTDNVKTVYNLLDKNLENYTKIKFNDVFNKYKTTKITYVDNI